MPAILWPRRAPAIDPRRQYTQPNLKRKQCNRDAGGNVTGWRKGHPGRSDPSKSRNADEGNQTDYSAATGGSSRTDVDGETPRPQRAFDDKRHRDRIPESKAKILLNAGGERQFWAMAHNV